ncbi:hypothetical protein EVAR_69476_1 [Eumeta japonica]|uniref:Uncharacterized protein n=1 Tax=Eumeta variegata TaxID=151549 RepID=A0A4C1SEV5_EUMVA|nr:hypothetical protein EVAR_69476_1 [Eumeta japonica]
MRNYTCELSHDERGSVPALGRRLVDSAKIGQVRSQPIIGWCDVILRWHRRNLLHIGRLVVKCVVFQPQCSEFDLDHGRTDPRRSRSSAASALGQHGGLKSKHINLETIKSWKNMHQQSDK